MVHALAIIGGTAMVVAVLLSALQTVVLPSGNLTAITRFMFALCDRAFIRRRGLPARFGWAGLYAPVSLVSLPLAWASVVTMGFALIFWGFDIGGFDEAFAVSGSSLFTLGFAKPTPSGLVVLTFLEALIGLGLVALLISFLPTLYGAFSDREKGVALLRPLVSKPASAVAMIERIHNGAALSSPTVWSPASAWFADLEQSHSSFPSLCSFPPQHADESWVVTAGTVLDAAALLHSSLPEDDPARSAEFMLLLAHGIPALDRVAGAAGLPPSDHPTLAEVLQGTGSGAEVAVTRAEFDTAWATLAGLGLTLRPDPDDAWRRFTELRACYEPAVLGLAGFAHVPPAPWTSDRAYVVGRPHFFGSRPLTVRPGTGPAAR